MKIKIFTILLLLLNIFSIKTTDIKQESETILADNLPKFSLDVVDIVAEYNANNWQLVSYAKVMEDPIRAIGCSDGEIFCATLKNNKIVIKNVNDNEEININYQRYCFFKRIKIISIKFLSDNLLAIGLNNNQFHICNFDGDIIMALENPERPLSFELSPENLLAVGGIRGISIWDLNSREIVKILKDGEIHVYYSSMQFISKNRLAAVGNPGRLEIWDIDTCEKIKNKYKYFGTQILSLPNNLLAITGRRNYIELIDLERVEKVNDIIFESRTFWDLPDTCKFPMALLESTLVIGDDQGKIYFLQNASYCNDIN